VLASLVTPWLTLTHDHEADAPLVSAVWGLYVLLVAAIMVLVIRPTN
jgi:hypothetical protein